MSECIKDKLSSRVCEKGTKCCNVRHKTSDCSKSDVERLVMPKHDVIYLIPGHYDGEDCAVWCDEPAPGSDDNPDDAIKYVKVKNEIDSICDEDLKKLIWSKKHQLKIISDYGLQLIIDTVREYDKS